MTLIFLNNDFYSDYQHYKEILQKNKRPYIMFLLCFNDHDYAIPFRSNIKHPNHFKTSDTGGIDFTKSVIIKDEYIDKEKLPKLRDEDFKLIKGKEFEIKQKFINYINQYIRHIKKLETEKAHDRDYNFCKFSTLQNYHSYLGLTQEFNIIIENFLNQKRE